MNRRQRSIILKFVVTILLTLAAVIGMIIFKDFVVKQESMRAMNQLNEYIKKYRQRSVALPGEMEIENLRENLEGVARLGKLNYRVKWIEFNSQKDTVLAYVKKDYLLPFLRDEYIFLTLGGDLRIMEDQEFEKLLDTQKSQTEKMLDLNGG